MGGGWGKGWGKGSGKGWGKSSPLGKWDATQKVWIGGLSEQVDRKKLQEHFNQVAKTKWVSVFGKTKTACVVYNTPEEATAAIAQLNGVAFEGMPLEVDVWTSKEKDAAA